MDRFLSYYQVIFKYNSFRNVIVDGDYPSVMLQAWLDWDKQNKSQNSNPSIIYFYNHYFTELYEKASFAIFLMDDVGIDLEHFGFLNCSQIFSILNQICCSISFAEKYLEFEHRDLYFIIFLLLDTREIF